ncbi:hypothetical protein [Haloferax larsenii]|uniref:Uncharacterized protein n=1 Tax=Haloferax larsenii TaxID=302484 RepID=A0A1H7N741_HALLR|nr:hypothetical protein [Haloferax larsenii]SEL19099.1 hypothetical protein SAMN04488691_103206 [Haloferax larsenii]
MVKHEKVVPRTGKTGWHRIAEYDDLIKWQYGDSPYRVIVHLNQRGHFEAVFTSWYGPPNYLIRGNCGGGHKGRMLALVAAKDWMDEHSHGCPPPRQMAEQAGQVPAL